MKFVTIILVKLGILKEDLDYSQLQCRQGENSPAAISIQQSRLPFIGCEKSILYCAKLHHVNNKRCIFHHGYRAAQTQNF
jgi:hypothetical protein